MRAIVVLNPSESKRLIARAVGSLPEVQEAMLRVVRELAATYGRHPSFAGMALRLSPDGYAQLPGPQWGMDDATISPSCD